MRPSVRLIKKYSNKKLRAARLRRRGKTYGEIAQNIKISKSTAYDWTRQIKLSKNARIKIERKLKEAFRKGFTAYNKMYGKIRSYEAAKIRRNIEEKSSKEIKRLSLNDLKLIGSALYWAEGNKKHRWHLRFGNSDPEIVRVIMQFFREVCKIPNKKIRARIHVYPGIVQKKALNFWSRITKLPKRNFYKPQMQISRASKNKRAKNTLPYGTLHLVAGNTEITSMVKGWIQGISEKIQMRV